jgi:hypothetical protein
MIVALAPIAVASPAGAIGITAVVPNMYKQISDRCYDGKYLDTRYILLNPPYNPRVPSEVVAYGTDYKFCL